MPLTSISTSDASTSYISHTAERILPVRKENNQKAAWCPLCQYKRAKIDQTKVQYLADLASKMNAPYICIAESHLIQDIFLMPKCLSKDVMYSEVTRLVKLMVIYVRKDFVIKTEVKESN
jgi:hypothetical protein